MCTDEQTAVQHETEQMQAPQGFGEAPESVPENHEEKMYSSPEAASGYSVGGQQMPQAPEGYVYQQPQMQMPPQPEMYQAPQMPQAPQGQPMYQMPPQPQMIQGPDGYMYQAPQMPQAPQGQPMYQMPPQPQMMSGPVPPQFIGQPQMQIPPMGGQPQQGGPKAGGCSHDHKQEDPFGGMFGMFGEMVDNNPNLSALNKMVGATNSDFLKGAMLGAGLTLLLTSDGVKEMLSGLFAGTMDMFGNEEDIGEEDE